jgi:hypothetical protein
LTHQAQDQIKSAVTDRKSQTVSSLDNMVDAIRSTGQTLRCRSGRHRGAPATERW